MNINESQKKISEIKSESSFSSNSNKTTIIHCNTNEKLEKLSLHHRNTVELPKTSKNLKFKFPKKNDLFKPVETFQKFNINDLVKISKKSTKNLNFSKIDKTLPIKSEMSFKFKDKFSSKSNNTNFVQFNKKKITKKKTFINKDYLNLNFQNKKFKLEKFDENILSDISINDEFFNKKIFDSSDDFKIESELNLINLTDEELFDFEIKNELHPKNLNKTENEFQNFLIKNGYSNENYDQKIILIIFLLKRIINYNVKPFVFNLLKQCDDSQDTIKENEINNNNIENIFNFVKNDL